MHLIHLLLTFALVSISLADGVKPGESQNPNVWDFSINRKVLADFQFNGIQLAIWEDAGVENTTIVSKRHFYVTPISEFLPNSTKCQFNDLTGGYFISYDIQLWNSRLQLAAMDRLKTMQIEVTSEQVQPLPFYQVRMIWNNAQRKLQKASLSTTWENNLQGESIRTFVMFVDDKETCDRISNTLQINPTFFTLSIALQYSLSAASTASRILSVKVDHFINSQMMAALKTMDVKSQERLLTSDDANQLTMQIMDNIVASQVVDGEYVPDTDQLALKDVVNNALQLQNADVANFSQIVWGSVYWDPVYARPDKITSYLNKILKINSGNRSISKSSTYDDKGEGGVDFGIGSLKFGGHGSGEKSGSASYGEMEAWFREHNYDVEIQGEMFVPKSLNLKKINTGVLNRQETIYTKSVQMHRVDAPGNLAVTVGSRQSIGENEDIKQLRQGIKSLTVKMNHGMEQMTDRFNKLEPTVENLEGRVSQLELELVNATFEDIQLTKRIVQIEIGIKPLISAAAAAQAHQEAVQKCKTDCDSKPCIEGIDVFGRPLCKDFADMCKQKC